LDTADRRARPLDLRSVATWWKQDPAPSGPVRQRAVSQVAGRVATSSPGRLRVVVDGLPGSGKTTFGNELAAALRQLGRPTLRASLDDFKYPWRHALDHGDDRVTGHGYYRNAYDFASARDLLLRPSGPDGSGTVVLCAFDPVTGFDHRDVRVHAPVDAILVVDTVFAFRQEYDEFWDVRIWLEVDPLVAFERGVARDQAIEGSEDAALLHRERYGVAESIYLSEVDAPRRADLVLENSDFSNLTIVRG